MWPATSIRPSSPIRDVLIGHHSSPYSAAWRMPSGPALPMAIGIAPRRGFGLTNDDSKRSHSPANDAGSSSAPAHAARSAAIRSRPAA